MITNGTALGKLAAVMVNVVLISVAAHMRDIMHNVKGGNYGKATPGTFRKRVVHTSQGKKNKRLDCFCIFRAFVRGTYALLWHQSGSQFH